jgi:4'-phosphopantetheinyl transferase
MDCVVYQARSAETAVPPSCLSRAERERWWRLPLAADRARFGTAAALLRVVAGQELGLDAAQVRIARFCPDCDRPHGKPEILGSDIQVSVSHSGHVVLVALAHGMVPIGVDVERVEWGIEVDDLAPLTLAPAELERIRGTDSRVDRITFFGLWTRKEALLKATGDGLRIPMSAVALTACGALSEYPARPELAARTVALATGNGYAAALAALADAPLVVRHVSTA